MRIDYKIRYIKNENEKNIFSVVDFWFCL